MPSSHRILIECDYHPCFMYKGTHTRHIRGGSLTLNLGLAGFEATASSCRQEKESVQADSHRDLGGFLGWSAQLLRANPSAAANPNPICKRILFPLPSLLSYGVRRKSLSLWFQEQIYLMIYRFILQNFPKSEVICRPSRIAAQEDYLKIGNRAFGVPVKGSEG